MRKNEITNELKKELKQNRTLVYELDLKNALDHEKAPQNELEQAVEYCRFICETGEEAPYRNFEVISGSLEEKPGYLQGILQEQPFCGNESSPDCEKKFSAVLPLHDRYDILNISFKGNAEQRFKMFLYGDDYLEYLKKGVQAEVPGNSKDNRSYKTLIAPPVTFDFEPQNNLSVFIGERLSDCILCNHTFQDTVSFSLDYKTRKIKINNQAWREVSSAALKNLKYFEICAALQNHSTAADFFHLDKTRYAKNEGYVYLKPITLPKGNYQIFLYHTGDISLEYGKGNNWRNIPQSFRLTEKENLRLRIKMKSGDKLNDLFIVNDNK